MKNLFAILILTIMLFSFTSISYSQDVIYMINGDSVVSKVTEISVEKIKYKDYTNLEGPQYIISKEGVSKIVFENGNEEIINETKQISLEETKAIIIEIFDKYAYDRTGDYKLSAQFDQNYLDLLYAYRKKPENNLWRKFYDFSGDCTFHKLSNRNKGISYINVNVYRMSRKKNGEFKKKNREKLVIKVKRQDKAKILRDALIRYNDFFNE